MDRVAGYQAMKSSSRGAGSGLWWPVTRSVTKTRRDVTTRLGMDEAVGVIWWRSTVRVETEQEG